MGVLNSPKNAFFGGKGASWYLPVHKNSLVNLKIFLLGGGVTENVSAIFLNVAS